jgi:GNAT superfamily N-acetyltransferase
MVDSKALLQATLDVGKGFFRPPPASPLPSSSGSVGADDAAQVDTSAKRRKPPLVPIRALSPRHRERIAKHLLALNADDRYLRFGFAAKEAQIRAYVAQLNFERDDIYGIYNRALKLIAVAHVAFSPDDLTTNCAEFGVSVLPQSRGKGLGTMLFERAIIHARSENVDLMFIHALSENAAMLKIARSAGAWVERDGMESQAYIKLPPATLDTRLTDAVEDSLGEVDFQLKRQAKRFWAVLGSLQTQRQQMRQRVRQQVRKRLGQATRQKKQVDTGVDAVANSGAESGVDHKPPHDSA